MPTVTASLKVEDAKYKQKLEAAKQELKDLNSQQYASTAKLVGIDNKLAKAKSGLTVAIKNQNKESQKALRNRIKSLNAERGAILSRNNAIKSTQELVKSNIKEQTKQTEGTKKGTKATESSTNSLVRHIRQLESLVVAYYAVTRAWQGTIGVGIEVNRIIEDNTAGFAALLSTNTSIVLSNGQVADSYEKFAIGQKLAAQTLEDVKKASVDTYATFPQLLEIMQQAIGQTLSMGDAFGTSVDEITQNTIKLSQRMSNIGGAIGMPMDRIREEIRSILSANASTDSLIATMIFGSPGEANKAIRQAKNNGENAVKDLLDGVLEGFDVLADVDSYTKNLLKLENSWQNLMQGMSEPLFEGLTEAFGALAKEIESNTPALVESFEDLSASIAMIGKDGGEMLQSFSEFREQLFGTANAIEAPLAGLGVVVSATMGYVTNAFNATALAILGYRLAWSKLTDSEQEFEAFRKSQEKTFKTLIDGIKSIEEVTKEAQSVGYSIRSIFEEDSKTNIKDNNKELSKTLEILQSLSYAQESETSLYLTAETVKYAKQYNDILNEINTKSSKATLQTMKAIDKNVLADAEKYMEKSLDKTAKLKESIKKSEEQLKNIAEARKSIADATTKTTKQEKIQKAALQKLDQDKATLLEANAQRTQDILSIEMKERLKLLSLENELELSKKRLIGGAISELELAQKDVELTKIKLDGVKEQGSTEEQRLKAQIEYNKALLKEQTIIEDIDWAKAVAEFEKFDPDFDEAEESVYKFSETIESQLGNGIANAIKAGFEGGTAKDVVSGFADSLGSALVSQTSSALAKNVISGTAIPGGALAGGAIGIGAMALSSFLNKDKSPSRSEKLLESIEKKATARNEKLDKQIGLYGALGDQAGKLISEYYKTTGDFKTEIQKIVAGSDVTIADNAEGYSFDADNATFKDTLKIISQIQTATKEQNILREDGWASQVRSNEQLQELIETNGFLFQGADTAEDALNRLNSATSEYATSLLNIRGVYKDLSDSLKGVYDGLNNNYYANLAYTQALDEVDALIGDKTFSDYLKGVITELDDFGATIENVESDLAGDDLEKRITALSVLEEVTGETFDGNSKTALKFLESIELVGKTMAETIELTSQFKKAVAIYGETQEETVSRLLEEANLQSDLNNITDSSLSLLREKILADEDATEAEQDAYWATVALKEAREAENYSMAEFADSIRDVDDTLKNVGTSLEFAKEQVGMLDEELPTTAKGLYDLRQAFLKNDGVVDTYEQKIIDATLATSYFSDELKDLTTDYANAFKTIEDDITSQIDKQLELARTYRSVQNSISDLIYDMSGAVTSLSDVNSAVKNISNAEDAQNAFDAIATFRSEQLDLLDAQKSNADVLVQKEQDRQDLITQYNQDMADYNQKLSDRRLDADKESLNLTISKLEAEEDVLRSFKDFADDLRITQLTENMQVGALKSKFDTAFTDLKNAVSGGDEDMGELASRTLGYASSYLDTLKTSGVSGSDFAFQQSRIANMLEDYSGTGKTATLDDLKTQLENVNETIVNNLAKPVMGTLDETKYTLEDTSKLQVDSIDDLDQNIKDSLGLLDGNIDNKLTVIDQDLQHLDTTFADYFGEGSKVLEYLSNLQGLDSFLETSFGDFTTQQNVASATSTIDRANAYLSNNQDVEDYYYGTGVYANRKSFEDDPAYKENPDMTVQEWAEFHWNRSGQYEDSRVAFATGTPNVPFDMTADIHRGEIIVPRDFSDGLRSGDLQMGNNKQIVDAINTLISKVESLENSQDKHLRKIEKNTDQKTSYTRTA